MAKTVVLGTRFTDSEYLALKERAQQHSMSCSQLIRMQYRRGVKMLRLFEDELERFRTSATDAVVQHLGLLVGEISVAARVEPAKEFFNNIDYDPEKRLFSVAFGHNPLVVKLLQSFPSRIFIKETKSWLIYAQHFEHAQLLNAMVDAGFKVSDEAMKKIAALSDVKKIKLAVSEWWVYFDAETQRLLIHFKYNEGFKDALKRAFYNTNALQWVPPNWSLRVSKTSAAKFLAFCKNHELDLGDDVFTLLVGMLENDKKTIVLERDSYLVSFHENPIVTDQLKRLANRYDAERRVWCVARTQRLAAQLLRIVQSEGYEVDGRILADLKEMSDGAFKR